MRVVGGKTGADGKLFAHIVWTVPGSFCVCVCEGLVQVDLRQICLVQQAVQRRRAAYSRATRFWNGAACL